MKRNLLKVAFAALCLLGILSFTVFIAKALCHDQMSYYYYQACEEPSIDDIVIALPASNSSTHGLFWGTSDEFCDAREGFLSGFCILELTDLRLCGDSISFILDSTDSPFFSKPVDTQIESSDQAVRNGYRTWRQMHEYFAAKVMLKGRISKDSLLLENIHYPHDKPYVFHRISPKELKSRQRNSLSKEEEDGNSSE